MDNEERMALIDAYIAAYNALDVDGMLAFLHPDVEFANSSGGEINASAKGIAQFRELAEQSRDLFTTRRQIVRSFDFGEDTTNVEIAFEGILARHMSEHLPAGETLRLEGRSEFQFKDGKIFRIIDIS